MKRNISILVLALLIFSCSDEKQNAKLNDELSALRIKLDSIEHLNAELSAPPKGQIKTFLTFQENNAEAAMNFYVGIFKNSEITHIQRYEKGSPAKEGTIMFATFDLNGSQFACSDSFVKHEWSFTPGVSVFVECKSDEEIEDLFAKLSENGETLMPLGNYGWSEKFAFIEDQFGVSWQLNLN